MTAKQLTIRDGNVEIHYFEQGQGEMTLLFLHGWCINATYWNHQIETFSESYAVYALDLPGFGRSNAQRTNWTVEEYAEDVTAFIETLQLKNVVIVGHSMAGEIMLQMALTNHPAIVGIVGVDNFKAIDVVWTPEQMQQMTDYFQRYVTDFKHAAPEYADLMLFHPETPKEVRERVKTDFAQSDSLIGYETCMHQMQYAYTDAQRLEQLDYRLYLINCDGLPINEAGLKHCKNGFSVEAIASSGHYPMIERPAAFNRCLTKLLEDIKREKYDPKN